MRYAIGISGPPRSGKDTLGEAIAARLNAHGTKAIVVALSMPMRRAAFALLGREYDLPTYERIKDQPAAAFGGATLREAMIALSEEHVKPRYGQEFWAHAGLEIAETSDAEVLVCTDVGFACEGQVFQRHFGPARCMWVQLQRPGTSFANDSRTYVGAADRTVRFTNPGVGLDFFMAAAQRVEDVAAHWGWSLTKGSHPTYTSLDVDGG